MSRFSFLASARNCGSFIADIVGLALFIQHIGRNARRTCGQPADFRQRIDQGEQALAMFVLHILCSPRNAGKR